jgi:hypothetical protein
LDDTVISVNGGMLTLSAPRWAVEFDSTITRNVLKQAGQEIAALARSKIRSAVGGGKVYRKGAKPSSAPEQVPVSQTGELAAKIGTRMVPRRLAVTVTDKAGFAVMLEGGAYGGGQQAGMPRGIGAKNKRSMLAGKNTNTKVSGGRILAPRPFLSTALDDLADSITQRVGKALIQGTSMSPAPK